ncbi:MAG TPA: orotidine-5'-phosphate decarboxylase [Gemmatimonadaceae bacterium]|nr:orotidine-5'-phosphate decarboxylase [Gemmatimonadaceae bacterium]
MSVTPIIALDVNSLGAALTLVERLGASARFYKVGSELFTAVGPKIVASLRARGLDVFLDLKFHDIPSTVAGAVRAATDLGVALTTVHASGGEAMLRAAVEAAGDRCRVVAVTVLTSLDGATVVDVFGRSGERNEERGKGVKIEAEVARLATYAHRAGIEGFVCSGKEAARLRASLGPSCTLVVPGIRFSDGPAHDQARTVTPTMAAQAGADYIVVGRAVTAATDPIAAMTRLSSELQLALKE